MRSSSGVIRLGGLAALVGGAMWVVKGGVIMLGGPDPDLFIPAQFVFALGLLGLHARLAGRGGLPGRVGGFLAYAAVGFLTPPTNIPSGASSDPSGGPNL